MSNDNKQEEFKEIVVESNNSKDKKPVKKTWTLSKLIILPFLIIFLIISLIFDKVKFYSSSTGLFIFFLITSVIFFGGYFYVYKKVNPEKVNKLLYFLIHDLIDYVVLIFFVLTFVLGYVAPGKVDGNSMRTTLDNDNSVLVWHFAYKPKVGDVVVVNMNEVQGADGLFIKRVRATEGDILKFKKVDDFNYNLYNNEILIGLIRNSDVKRILTQDISLEDEIIYAIPKEKFLMIGDNWDNSTDSRFYGLIDYKYCLGKAFFCISKMKWL